MVTDRTMPEGSWSFDQNVTDAFDDMLERSIPAYNVMRDLTTRLAIHYVQPGSDVVDLGCSRGAALAGVKDWFDRTTDRPGRYVGVDISEPMLEAAAARFRPSIESGDDVVIRFCDLRYAYPEVAASVTLAVLTIQFTPMEHRWRILQDAYNSTLPGGALLLVEKVLGASAELHATMDDEYLRFKGRNGYSDEAIARKRASLEGVLVSQTAFMNERMLHDVGFRHVDAYYRWLNFAGWIAVR